MSCPFCARKWIRIGICWDDDDGQQLATLPERCYCEGGVSRGSCELFPSAGGELGFRRGRRVRSAGPSTTHSSVLIESVVDCLTFFGSGCGFVTWRSPSR
jgi:hypothetical protein